MASYVKLDAGRVNIDAIAMINQQVGGAYRVRFTDGMVQTITQADGDKIVAAIDKESNETKIEEKIRAADPLVDQRQRKRKTSKS